jgi:hypothetical protein
MRLQVAVVVAAAGRTGYFGPLKIRLRDSWTLAVTMERPHMINVC